jgi:hypothetical protein
MKILDVRAASVGDRLLSPESDAMEEALKRGADELMNVCEFSLELRPLALAEARRLYRNCCHYLFLLLEEHRRRASE